MVTARKPLTVYKASAGSGKTFTLASEYIRLLVQNPQQYRNILAVTFTNKATEEMKMRILSQLYGIGQGLADSDDYLRHICEMTGYEAPLVRKRANIALHNLLHNYSYFRVSTIDTFFQSVLRNLAHELELTANLRVELNDTQVEEQAIDELIQDLQTTDLTLQWILRYVMDNIEEDHSWNVIGSIKNFGSTIFKDYYKEHSSALNEKMGEKDFFEHYTQELNEQRQQALQRMMDIGVSFFSTLEGESLEISDLKNGKNIASFFQKLQNGEIDDSAVNKTVLGCSEGAVNWCKKGTEAELIPIVEQVLMPILDYALKERPRQWHRYQSATLTLRHLNQLRLLGQIEQKVRELNTEANRFLLSDTQQLLHELIKGSDSPFIFEKIGTQLEHIMIDEFQDTSTVQWKNFKVLLEECMSHEDTQNLIVGDVKQSIYRWRSGDWRLLNDIEQHFPQPKQQLDVLPLKTNYRSQRNIIEFNNHFFELAAEQEYKQLKDKVGEQMAQQVQNAYQDVKQEIPANRDKTGKIQITLFPNENYREQVLRRLVEIVCELRQQGASASKIAILIRKKDVIPDIIEYFASYLPDINIVSDEAFRLDASLLVNTLIYALHLLIHPDDNIVKATLAKNYQKYILKHDIDDGELLRSDVNLDVNLPQGYMEEADQLLRMPLSDLTERLYQLFELQHLKDENAYLCTFYDYLNDYCAENATDIDSFLRYWDETLCSKTIQSDEVDGIRLLTIHKSKGLEFEHVLLPFCDWRLERTQNNIIWCEAEDEPYKKLPLVPVDYSSKMAGSTYEHAYFDEYLQNRVDNLNLLYVAFTRARNNLFVLGKRNSSATRSQLIQDVIPQLQEQLEGVQLTGDNDKQCPLVFDYGTLCTETKAHEASDNVFLKTASYRDVNIQAYENKTSFKQSNKSRDFIEGEDIDEFQANYIKAGCVLHDVFAHIRTTEDIDNALRQLQLDGILYDAQLTPERLGNMIRKRLEDPRVKDWFSGRWKLYNECTILSMSDGQVVERRPDRVMTDGKEMIVVDFKFGKPKTEYHEQVREYMDLLHKMGHENIKGYLWYVYNNKIEEV